MLVLRFFIGEPREQTILGYQLYGRLTGCGVLSVSAVLNVSKSQLLNNSMLPTMNASSLQIPRNKTFSKTHIRHIQLPRNTSNPSFLTEALATLSTQCPLPYINNPHPAIIPPQQPPQPPQRRKP